MASSLVKRSSGWHKVAHFGQRVKTTVPIRLSVNGKKIEVPTKKTKVAQKSTKEHKVGQTGTKWDKKPKRHKELAP
jgi:hypothetical protein